MIKAAAKSILSRIPLSGLSKKKKYYFVFHDISEQNELQHSDLYSTEPHVFEAQLEFLSKTFSLVGLDDFDVSGSKPLASVMFDDGFASVKDRAMPILNHMGIPFSICVNKNAIINDSIWITNFILGSGNREYLEELYDESKLEIDLSLSEFLNNPFNLLLNKVRHSPHCDLFKYINDNRPFADDRIFLAENDIIELEREGVAIGSHSVFHFNLGNCDKEIAYAEVFENKKYLEGLLKTRICHFALPFGKKEHYTGDVLNMIYEQGHDFIYTTNPMGYSFKADQPLPRLIPRIGLTNESTEELSFYINRSILRTYDL